MARPRSKASAYYQPTASAGARACEHPGCAASGDFRAPRGRDQLNDYYWFCLDHVRAYNAAWDYYKGMNEDEIERARRDDTVGWRPTWPMGPNSAIYRLDPEQLRAAFNRFFEEHVGGTESAPPRAPRATTPEEEALAVMDLDSSATQDEVKARYKALVKQHHPDANGGDKAAEERLKSINQAYTFLKTQAQNAKFGAGN
jgi:hypothetical protein